MRAKSYLRYFSEMAAAEEKKLRSSEKAMSTPFNSRSKTSSPRLVWQVWQSLQR